MMIKHLQHIAVALLLLCTVSLHAQQQPNLTPADTALYGKYRVGIMAKAFGDSIVVRWAPNHAALFRQALRTGYLLTRETLVDGKKAQIDFQITVKPWTKEEWLKKASPRDTLAAACSQLVNGSNSPVRANEALTLDKILDQQNQNDLRLLLALTLADVSPRNATGMALGFVDRNVKKGVTYQYSIVPLTSQELYPVTATGNFLKNERGERPVMVSVKTTSGEHLIRLKWDRTLAESRFSSYYVERSEDNGKTFRRITKRPWMQPAASPFDDVIEFPDSVAQNYRRYSYRVLGITPFGELAPSETISATGIDKTPPPAVEKASAKQLQGSTVRLQWSYKNVADLAGFVIAKGTNMEGPFTPLSEKILPQSSRDFTDTTALANIPAYYRIIAVDTARNLGFGLPLYCVVTRTMGPAKPTGLQGYIDTTGLVRLVWEPNREQNILGYRVLSANAREHVFTADTKGYLAIAAFNDSTVLKTLTRKKYFRVIAYDQSYNPSEPSDILELTRPDRIRPSTPVISGYTVGDSSVVINWVPSSSEDVMQQIVLRRGKSTERWQEIAKIDKSTSTYADRSVKNRSEYSYAVVAVDESGLRSDQSFPLQVKTPKKIPAVVGSLRGFLNPDKTVSLYWNYDVPNCRFTIFRSSGNDLISYDSVYDNKEFRDKRPEKGTMRYAVKAFYKDGTESVLSKIIEIEVK